MNVLQNLDGKLTFITLPFSSIVFSTGLIRSFCTLITISLSAFVKAIALTVPFFKEVYFAPGYYIYELKTGGYALTRSAALI
jgi:hypothetical protein